MTPDSIDDNAVTLVAQDRVGAQARVRMLGEFMSRSTDVPAVAKAIRERMALVKALIG